MSEEREELIQEVAETEETAKEVCCKRKGCITHKLFGLKGLSIIWKFLSVFVLVYMLYLLVMLWFYSFKEHAPFTESLNITLQIIVTYGLYSLVFITISRVCKVLKKIKHAVEHK